MGTFVNIERSEEDCLDHGGGFEVYGMPQRQLRVGVPTCCVWWKEGLIVPVPDYAYSSWGNPNYCFIAAFTLITYTHKMSFGEHIEERNVLCIAIYLTLIAMS